MSLDTLKPKVAELIEKVKNAGGGGGGGNTDEIEAIIDNSGVLDSTEGTVEEKVEALIDKAEEQKLWYEWQENYAVSNTSPRLFEKYQGVKLPKFNLTKFENISRLCCYAKNITEIDFYINCENATSGAEAFYGTSALKKMRGIYCRKMTSIKQMFNDSGIEEIELPFDISSVVIASQATAFNYASKLKEVRFISECIKVSIVFGSPILSAESIQSIIDGLATVETAQTLTLNENAKILQSQVDSANAKGWTVAGGIVVSEEEYYG